jgi:hypothetical protein
VWGGPGAACTGPTPREIERDALIADRANVLAAPERPRLNPPPEAPAQPADSLETCVRELASSLPLARIQAANQLKRAAAEGISACLRVLLKADVLVNTRILEFLAAQDYEAYSADVLEGVREAAAKQLKIEVAAVRQAAAQMLGTLGAGGARTEFLSAITDKERKIRWAVVQRFAEHPDELGNAQLMVLANYLGDSKLDSATRGDVYTLLLAVFEKYSRGLKPESYDAFADPKSQAACVTAWEGWARAVVITPLPR